MFFSYREAAVKGVARDAEYRVRRRSTWPVLEVLARIGAVWNLKYNTRYYVGDSISYMDQKVQYMYQK